MRFESFTVDLNQKVCLSIFKNQLAAKVLNEFNLNVEVNTNM